MTKLDDDGLEQLHREFLELLPAVRRHAAFAFRHKTADAAEEAVAEVVANVYCAYRRLYERGELQRAFVSALSSFAIRQFRGGRRVGTSLNSRDIFSPRSLKEGFTRQPTEPADESGFLLEELIPDEQVPVAEQVQFKLDTAEWISRLDHRNREIVSRLAMGCSNVEIAIELEITPGRVSQLRRQLEKSWRRFMSD